jgi:hypothetical protein
LFFAQNQQLQVVAIDQKPRFIKRQLDDGVSQKSRMKPQTSGKKMDRRGQKFKNLGNNGWKPLNLGI